jgi:hypothetical protein
MDNAAMQPLESSNMDTPANFSRTPFKATTALLVAPAQYCPDYCRLAIHTSSISSKCLLGMITNGVLVLVSKLSWFAVLWLNMATHTS